MLHTIVSFLLQDTCNSLVSFSVLYMYAFFHPKPVFSMKHPVQDSHESATTTSHLREGIYNSPDGIHNLYVALGLQEHEIGYPIVAQTTQSIGERRLLTPSLWQLTTSYPIEEAFKTLNASMMDRRIDSYSSLLIFDPISGQARWHLRQPLSDLMHAHWGYLNNVLISFSLLESSHNHKQLIQCITQLGIWAPLSKSTWYLSTSYSSKHVFQSLLSLLYAGDQLCVFDSQGQLAIWHNRKHIKEAVELVK